jgi:hypothetical protein
MAVREKVGGVEGWNVGYALFVNEGMHEGDFDGMAVGIDVGSTLAVGVDV